MKQIHDDIGPELNRVVTRHLGKLPTPVLISTIIAEAVAAITMQTAILLRAKIQNGRIHGDEHVLADRLTKEICGQVLATITMGEDEMRLQVTRILKGEVLSTVNPIPTPPPIDPSTLN